MPGDNACLSIYRQIEWKTHHKRPSGEIEFCDKKGHIRDSEHLKLYCPLSVQIFRRIFLSHYQPSDQPLLLPIARREHSQKPLL